MLPEGKCRYIDGQIYPDGNFYVLDTQHIKHNGSELKSALNGISTDISNKVDKETGKGLSTNDYTDADKNKLSGIEDNANNYVHPTTSGNKHIPSGGSSGKILGWSADGTAAWVDPASGGGDVSSVKVGSTTYNPDSSGIVGLPAYPTSLPASDVYSWAKASSKPTYTASEVGLGNVGNFKAVSTVASQGLSTTEKSNARTNIGAGIGTVTEVKVGSTSYSPSSGVVSLPAYPTSLPADGGTAANVSGTVAVANGGTGATSASGARTNLGLGTAATKSSTTSITSGSSALITSGAVYSKISPTSFSTVSAIGSYISNIEGGYAKIGNLVVVNIRCTVNTAVPSSWTNLMQGLPYPVLKNGTGSSAVALANNKLADIVITGVGQISSSTAIASGTTLIISGTYITK